MEQRNFFQFAKDFVSMRISNIKQNRMALVESPESADRKRLIVKIVLDIAVLAGLLSIAVFVLYQSIQLILMVYNFLAKPQHRALMIIVRGLIVIFFVALIIESFQKKPKLKTEREEDSIKKTLARDLLSATQKLSRMYGLERPDSTGDLSSFELSPCEDINGVSVFKFTIEKDVSSEKPFSELRFRKSLIRRLKKMERDYELTTATPYGFIHNDEELCSILIFDVIDSGDYIEIHTARADEESYALYKKVSGKDNNNPQDPDF